MSDQRVPYIAHSAATQGGEPQPLEAHLNAVAEQCADFAAAFGAADMGYAAGLGHDAGKSGAAFIRRIEGGMERADHKSCGAQLLVSRYGASFGKLMAYSVAGHHGGLPNAFDFGADGKATLEEILQRPTDADMAFCESLAFPAQAKRTPAPCNHMGNAAAFLARMLFSCLVDADYLDTEKHFEPEKHALRGGYPTLDALSPRYEAYMNALCARANARQRADPSLAGVHAQREYVKARCYEAAALAPGFFSLQVPTGGGKTLSSMGFALRHAQIYGMRRIVLAVPFTTVTEQNAGVLRQALGEDAVLEHHSSVAWANEDTDDVRSARLACENWDAPVIVTTNVQLFDSLYSHLPSKCRKLHRLAGSVIVLDEAQAIPDEVLKPCLLALWLLCRDYGCSVVLCTATQPDYTGVWPEQVDMRPIIPDADRLFQQMRRTSVAYAGKLSDAALCQELRQERQALCIVNTRAHAAALYAFFKGDAGVFHLSARMCPAHRTAVFECIRTRLEQGERCVVIATNLVEAGVDIDFPCVYRAIAGLDSIIQAAGRCNREGRLDTGRVIVFDPESGLPHNWLGRMAGLGREVMQLHDDPTTPEAIAAFYRLRFGGGTNLDKGNVLRAFEDTARKLDFPFRQVGENFRLIEDASYTVIIPYDDTARSFIAQMHAARYPAWYLSRLQRYVVGVYEREYEALCAAGRIWETDGMATLICGDEPLSAFYSEETGLVIPSGADPLIL